MPAKELLTQFYAHLRELQLLRSTEALLEWDHQVMMPPSGAAYRASQTELLATLVHRRATDPAFVDIVDSLASNLSALPDRDVVNVRETKRELDRKRRLSEGFVAERSRLCSECFTTWADAKPRGEFGAVAPLLERIVILSREEASLYGYEAHPYDALLEGYEPGATLATVKPVLLEVGSRLTGMLPDIVARFGTTSESPFSFPEEAQRALCLRVAADLGYSADTGRLDTSAHPFQSSLGPRDARITTRWDERNYLSALFGVIHEVGHALYELGLPEEHFGTPKGSAVSLGLHESQSRLWENLVGRSRAFAGYLLPLLKEYFPEEHARLDEDGLWRALNHVRPSLVRVEADEVTYSLHIVIRLIIEEALIDGSLTVQDLPGAWSDLYFKYLGVRPSSHREGVLQDVHWYGGSIGYFPTYALGNLYGAMMFEKIRIDLPNIEDEIRLGAFGTLLEWLRKNVHHHGMTWRGPELIHRIVGTPLDSSAFISYIGAKFRA